MSELGERLRRERVRRRERQVDTAERFGITQPSYYRWESGENNPEDDQFAEIARFLGSKIEEIWRMVYGKDPAPTSLEGLRTQVNELQRDIIDLRAIITELLAAAGGDSQPETPPPTPPPAPSKTEPAPRRAKRR